MTWEFVGPACNLGESPFWHPVERLLYGVDIAQNLVWRNDVLRGETWFWTLPQEPGCIAPAASGGLVLGLRDGIYRARTWEGPLEPIALFNHGKHTRFNDGKVDALGRFWAGTIYEPKDARKADLYCIDCRPDNGNGGKPIVQLKAHNATTANGLAWSPGSDTVYWADTPRHEIYAWDWEPQANVMRKHRVFHAFPGKPAGWQPGQPGYGGRPDGAAVDAQGHYWCAMYEGGRVVRLSPAGQVVAEYEIPVACPTMPCFGGPDLKTLFVTSARKGRPPAELQKYPFSGSALSMRVDVPGLPVNFFID